MQVIKKIEIIILIVCFMVMGQPLYAGDTSKIIVFAAASTTNAVSEICVLFEKSRGTLCVPSFAASSTLAKQIENGAPADVYISANPNWMDYLDKKQLLEPGTRSDLLANRIVLIAPIQSNIQVNLSKNFKLAVLLGDGRLSMGDPGHVPCGIYGKKALESFGQWADVSAKVIRAKDVRSALYFVERNEAPLGIVYATDAKISKKVKVVDTFPENCHPAITYPTAVIKGKASVPVKDFLAFLTSSDAKNVFNKYGFTVK